MTREEEDGADTSWVSSTCEVQRLTLHKHLVSSEQIPHWVYLIPISSMRKPKLVLSETTKNGFDSNAFATRLNWEIECNESLLWTLVKQFFNNHYLICLFMKGREPGFFKVTVQCHSDEVCSVLLFPSRGDLYPRHRWDFPWRRRRLYLLGKKWLRLSNQHCPAGGHRRYVRSKKWQGSAPAFSVVCHGGETVPGGVLSHWECVLPLQELFWRAVFHQQAKGFGGVGVKVEMKNRKIMTVD